MTKPQLATDTPSGRMYVHPVTKEYWYSVTTILENGVPKPGLVRGATKVAARYAVEHWEELQQLNPESAIDVIATAHERLWGKAAAAGDEVHEEAEAFTTGSNGSLPHMRQLQEFFNVTGYKPHLSEITVVNRIQGYAGTADLIAEKPNGEYALIDYKTGKGIWPEHFLQVEALGRAAVILSPDGAETEMPYLGEVGVLHLRPRSWGYYRVKDDTPMAEGNYNAFLSALGVAEWRRKHYSLVHGPRLTAWDWEAA